MIVTLYADYLSQRLVVRLKDDAAAIALLLLITRSFIYIFHVF